MSIKSMTGFARTSGADPSVSWAWEVRSVNGRGLEVRLRLPPGYEGLEPAARESVARSLARGNVSANLTVLRQSGAAVVRINEAALEQVLRAADHLHQLTGCERPRAEGLLALKGVFEVVEEVEDEATVEARKAAMLASLAEALQALIASRQAEGRRLAQIITGQIDTIERLVGEVEASPARTPEAIQKRFSEQVARLIDAGRGVFDPQRLAQEATLIATRVDVEEELKRLTAHIESARELLGESAAVGRRLDFLSQEFNREANTLCSKSNDIAITRAGLALKATIDQMREQLQNIE